jgi:hypothetical protein
MLPTASRHLYLTIAIIGYGCGSTNSQNHGSFHASHIRVQKRTVEGLSEEGPEKRMLADHGEQYSRLYLRSPMVSSGLSSAEIIRGNKNLLEGTLEAGSDPDKFGTGRLDGTGLDWTREEGGMQESENLERESEERGSERIRQVPTVSETGERKGKERKGIPSSGNGWHALERLLRLTATNCVLSMPIGIHIRAQH